MALAYCWRRHLRLIAPLLLTIFSCVALFFCSRSVQSRALSGEAALEGPTVADLERSFQTPPDDARIMMRWWWFGPSVTKAEIEREMRQMKQAGVRRVFGCAAPYP